MHNLWKPLCLPDSVTAAVFFRTRESVVFFTIALLVFSAISDKKVYKHLDIRKNVQVFVNRLLRKLAWKIQCAMLCSDFIREYANGDFALHA